MCLHRTCLSRVNKTSLISACLFIYLLVLTCVISCRDRPIFFLIFKHFTIIGYQFWKKKTIYIYIYIYYSYYYYLFFFVTYTIIQSITSSEMCSLYLTHPSVHTPGAVDTHTHTHLEQWTHTHTHTPGAVDTHTHTHTHTWSSGHTHTHRM